MNGSELFNKFRREHPVFRYRSYSVVKDESTATICFDFSVDGFCEFHPTLKTPLEAAVNGIDSPAADRMIFFMGMVELVSYWKALCPPRVIVECGGLDSEDILWWKKLYFNGLGEFFYINGIEPSFDSFMTIECTRRAEPQTYTYKNLGLNLVPIGGGKDSDVTLELLKGFREKNRPFTVNSQKARTDAILSAGYGEADTVCVKRTIDKELLRLNAEGCLNGHTPFSAVVAFSGLLCGYLMGAESIVLSNESSANVGNIQGLSVNHQYSKSYEFEKDFALYVNKHFGTRGSNINISYFSILRGFSELQIAKQFSALPQYHEVFRSCNAGSKKNLWCCNCPKCLFVYSILSPFVGIERLTELFGEELLSRSDLSGVFDGLVGLSPVKPFECVGTVEEVRLALAMTAKSLREENKPLPKLLEHFSNSFDIDELCSDKSLLTDFNYENNIPQKFLPGVKEMYSFVSAVN